MTESEGQLKFLIVSPLETEGPVKCDSLRLDIANGLKKNQGGSYGIRKGHAKSVFELEDGFVRAFEKGKLVFEQRIGEGFATVENNFVTVTTEKIYPNPDEKTSE